MPRLLKHLATTSANGLHDIGRSMVWWRAPAGCSPRVLLELPGRLLAATGAGIKLLGDDLSVVPAKRQQRAFVDHVAAILHAASRLGVPNRLKVGLPTNGTGTAPWLKHELFRCAADAQKMADSVPAEHPDFTQMRPARTQRRYEAGSRPYASLKRKSCSTEALSVAA